MKDYSTERIRNVCLMSHGGAGKTSLAEAILFNTGVLDRLGRITDGTTTLDYDPEEIKRNISINTAIGSCEWKGYKINIIDTPGYFDFVGEVKEGIRVADAAIILLSAKDGVTVGTEKSWDYAKEQNIPRVFYINKMDEEHANFFSALSSLQNTFGNNVVAFEIPVFENEKFVGVVDIVSMKAYKYEKNKQVDIDIPPELKDKVDEARTALIELVAETSEELMEKYFSGEEFTREELYKGIKAGIADGTIVPVLCGCALSNQAVNCLMDMIVEFLPSPSDNPVFKAHKYNSEDEIELKCCGDECLSALVFKTIVDPFVGKISMFRVYSGSLTPDTVVYNPTSDKTEKITQLFMIRGKKYIPVEKLIAGDIGAVTKLSAVSTNDTLCSQSKPVVLKKIQFPNPVLPLAIEPKSKGDEEKISAGLQKLLDEDPTFKIEVNKETRQTLIYGIGEQHLDIIVSKLKAKYNVEVKLTDPKVPYRETIKKKVKAEGKHKKQSGGHGQYGHVWIEFEPGDRPELTFEEKIFGGAVPKQYFPAVEKGLLECIEKGVLAGYPVVNLKATLVDGSYHPVDSSEMAFKIAASLAYKAGLPQASPVLLEPIVRVEVYVPDSYTGDIMGDLNKRRGRILGMNPQGGGIQQVVAEVPQAEMFKYATDLRSMTQGRGYFNMEFVRYEEAPPAVSEKVIEEAKKMEAVNS